MPSNDDMQHQNEEARSDRVSADAAVSSIVPDEHTAGAVEVSTDERNTAPLSLDDPMPLEFTFFQKKKHADKALLVPSVTDSSSAQVVAFDARLYTAEAANTKTKQQGPRKKKTISSK